MCTHATLIKHNSHFVQIVLDLGSTSKRVEYNYNISMKDLRFEWDERKAKSNLSKHGVSFEEAKTVFYDDAALVIADPDNSETEDRFVILG